MATAFSFNQNRAVGFVIALVLFAWIAFYGLVVFWPQPRQTGPVKIEVSRGSSLAEVARTLQSNDVIDNVKPFVLAAQLMGYEKRIRAGVFLLMDVTSNFKVIQQLVSQNPVVHRITIPEGLGLGQVAEMLQQKLGVDSYEFLNLCENRRFVRSLGLDVPSLEGFLTPETYLFYEGESARAIIETMVNQHHTLFNDSLTMRAEELGLTHLEVVTLASIIEGEAIHNSERSTISAVYHNRLKKGMKLQADPTIQYIIEDSPRRLLKEDLMIESPYNTYLNPGLPSGPINNPGKESILAALYPDDVDYLYFVATGDGYHTFTKTEKEHRVAKRKLQLLRRKLRREKQRSEAEIGGNTP